MTIRPRARHDLATLAVIGTIGLLSVMTGVDTAVATDTATTTEPASASDLPPGFPERVAVADPALGLGDPQVPGRLWYEWALASINVVDEHAFIRRGDDGHPTGALVVRTIGTNVWSGYGNDQGPIDVGADVDAHLDEFGGRHRVVWERGSLHQAVDWLGDVSEAEGVALARLVASGATPAVPGAEEVAAASASVSVHYTEGNEGTVAITTHVGAVPIDAETMAFAALGAAEPAGDGVFDASTTYFGRRLYVQVAPTLVAEVIAGSNEIDIDAVARSLVTVPTSELAEEDFYVPPDVDRPPDPKRRFGDSAAGRWVLEQWTGLSDEPCGLLVTGAAWGVVAGGCASYWGAPLCVLSAVTSEDSIDAVEGRTDVAVVTEYDGDGLTLWLVDNDNREIAIDPTVATDAGDGLIIATGSSPTPLFREIRVRIDGNDVECGEV